MRARVIACFILVVAAMLLPTASAYTLDVTAPSEELAVGVPAAASVLVTVACEEIQTYGTPGSDSVRFSVATVPAEGVALVGPDAIQIPRAPCNQNPQGETTFTAEFQVDVAPHAVANQDLVSSIEVLPFAENPSGFGPVSEEPERADPVEMTVRVGYFARVDIEITEPLIKSVGSWFQVDMTCACNADTLVSFTSESSNRFVQIPADIILGRAGTVEEYERTLVFIDAKGYGPEGGTWTFTATTHANGDPAAVGESTTFSVMVPPQEEGQESPFPVGLALAVFVGLGAAYRRRY